MKYLLFTILALFICNIAQSQKKDKKFLKELYNFYKTKEYVRVDDSLCPIIDVVPDEDGNFCYIEVMLPSGLHKLPKFVYEKHVRNIFEIKNGEIFSYKKQIFTGKRILKHKTPDPNIDQAYIGYDRTKNELVLVLIKRGT